jgi:acetolactate synthase I/III small subunit
MHNPNNSSQLPTQTRCHLLGDTRIRAENGGKAAVLELTVRNHPGAMSHITGLFARRAFNLEAIACAPVGDGTTSTMLLLVRDEPRLHQVERQLEKLYDVLSLRHRPEIASDFFERFIAGRA